MKASALRSTPAAFPRDDLVLPFPRPHDDRLEYSASGDRVRQLGHRRIVEAAARLIGIGHDRAHRQRGRTPPGLATAAGRLLARKLTKQRRQAAAKSRRPAHAATTFLGSRAMT